MLIDTLDIKFSGNVRNKTISGPDQITFINQWKTLLLSVGWTQVEGLHASASVTFPLGTPITDGVEVLPKVTIGCSAPAGFISIGDVQYTLYDPYKQLPGTSVACVFVAMDTTYAGTLANLLEAINDETGWFATITFNGGSSYTLDLLAIPDGPEFNEKLIQSNGFLSGTAVSSGGGYRLRSSSADFAAVYDCAMTAADRNGAGDNYLAGLLKFDFTINGQHVVYQLLNDVQGTLGFMGALGVGSVHQYIVIANPHGFSVMDAPRDASTHQFRAISLFCMAPYFPTAGVDVPDSEIFVPTDAVFVIGPNNIGDAPCWNNPNMAPSAWSLGDGLFQTDGFNPMPRVLAYRSPTYALQTIYSVPIYGCAYVQFGNLGEATDHAFVIGKLWDCAVVSDFIGLDGCVLDGKQFLVLGYGGGTDGQTVTTFLMACGLPGRSSLPPIGQSSRCASAPGNPGEGAFGNSGH